MRRKYRPVSNLQFLSKLAKKAVAQQAVSRVTACVLFPKLRWAYRQFHSTETASLRVHNDILLKMNKQDVSLLVFLDLSSAFDMIDHMVLLRRLEDKFVFCRTALLFVPVGQIPAGLFDIDFGVPQGSCIRLLLFSIYTGQLLDIVTQHLPTVHCYADDTKLYLAFRPGDRATQDSAVAAMEACIQDVRE